MRKLIVFNMLSLDGYFEGLHNDLSWHQVDEEFNEFAIEQLRKTDILLFGRKTYELMAGYWPTPDRINDNLQVAEIMNSYPKIVFSKTLKKAEWNNTQVLGENVEQELRQLKNQSGKDLIVLGSADLCSSLTDAGLIDEYRMMVNPVVVGRGTPFFKQENKMGLRLLKAKVFGNGNVLLCYHS